MTYHLTRGRARNRFRRRPRPRQAMGGLFDFVDDMVGRLSGLGVGSVQDARAQVCLGDADSATAELAARVESLDRTWNPTGFYDQDQMQTVIIATINFANAARDRISAALEEVDIRDGDHAKSAEVFDAAYQALSDKQAKSDLFVTALRQAQTSNTRVIDAPGLKVWVVDMMKASKDLAKAAFFVNCNKSTLERVSGFLNAVVDQAIEIIKAVVGVALEIGERAVHVVGDLAGLLASIIKFAPWLVLAGGGYYFYRSYKGR